MRAELTDSQWAELRRLVAEDNRAAFEALFFQIVQQQIRDRLAKREAERPVKGWIPSAY